MKKKLLCMVLGLTMALSLTAFGAEEESSDQSELTGEETEAAAEEESWDEAAWEEEPLHDQELVYFYAGDLCTSGPYLAEKLGYFEEEGLKVKGMDGSTYTEALSTGAAQLAVGHIATMLVPATNGSDLTFVAGAHIGCKSLYVLGDSEYNSTEDLKGQKISAPNGIGGSDYNILARLFDKDGINPMEDINLVQVENSACVTAMQNGEIAGALFSDTYAYPMVADGTLKKIRSMGDEDFKNEPCCVLAMNASFIKENPITAQKAAAAVQKASEWMRENPEEGVKMLMDDDKIGGDYDMNVEIWKSLEFGVSDEMTEAALEQISSDYIRLGLLTAYDDPEEIMDIIWTPSAKVE